MGPITLKIAFGSACAREERSPWRNRARHRYWEHGQAADKYDIWPCPESSPDIVTDGIDGRHDADVDLVFAFAFEDRLFNRTDDQGEISLPRQSKLLFLAACNSGSKRRRVSEPGLPLFPQEVKIDGIKNNFRSRASCLTVVMCRSATSAEIIASDVLTMLFKILGQRCVSGRIHYLDSGRLQVFDIGENTIMLSGTRVRDALFSRSHASFPSCKRAAIAIGRRDTVVDDKDVSTKICLDEAGMNRLLGLGAGMQSLVQLLSQFIPNAMAQRHKSPPPCSRGNPLGTHSHSLLVGRLRQSGRPMVSARQSGPV